MTILSKTFTYILIIWLKSNQTQILALQLITNLAQTLIRILVLLLQKSTKNAFYSFHLKVSGK